MRVSRVVIHHLWYQSLGYSLVANASLSPNTTLSHTHSATKKTQKITTVLLPVFKMSSSMTLKERLEGILRNCEELTNQNTYPRRHPSNFKDFKVEIPEFEGEQDPDDFLEWM